MHTILACGFCGTPTDHVMLIHTVLAGGLLMPWYARTRIGRIARRGIRRLQGRPETAAAACQASP